MSRVTSSSDQFHKNAETIAMSCINSTSGHSAFCSTKASGVPLCRTTHSLGSCMRTCLETSQMRRIWRLWNVTCSANNLVFTHASISSRNPVPWAWIQGVLCGNLNLEICVRCYIRPDLSGYRKPPDQPTRSPAFPSWISNILPLDEITKVFFWKGTSQSPRPRISTQAHVQSRSCYLT